jgi:anaerobic magnesium-protoporphyrin IX monomethyl ester cyclase
MSNLKVLVMEPPNQQLPIDTARPNGALGPAYIVGALRDRGIHADYLDGTVGPPGDSLEKTFYNRVMQEHGLIRYGMTRDRMAEVFAQYDVIATSSIFSAQTRLHFEVAEVAKEVAAGSGRRMLVVGGGVNARAMREHFLDHGFDVIALAEGERTMVEIIEEFERPTPDFSNIAGIAFRKDGKTVATPAGAGKGRQDLDQLPRPALDALPLALYRDMGIPHAGLLPKGTMFTAIQTSRGCQDECTFCHISMEKLHPELVGKIGYLREFSKNRVAEDVDRAVALGVSRLYFEDDNLFFSKRRLAELAPALTRPGLQYSNVNGANLRFLFKKRGGIGSYEVDTDFIHLLAEFGLKELVLPFESRSIEIMTKYASGKYNPDAMDSQALVRELKKAGIRIAGNFMIGFHDESWESILRTKEFGRQLFAEGLDAIGFMIPVPYPGSLDFHQLMADSSLKAQFDADPLHFTDNMHWRAKPLFPTEVPGEKLEAAIREFWLELNDAKYTATKLAQNVSTSPSSVQ